MKKFLNLALIIALAVILTGCPDTTGLDESSELLTGESLTEKIASANRSADFNNLEIAEDAVVSKAVTVKNLKLGGKTLTIEASGTVLQNVSNAVIIVDQNVGDGDVTLTGCSDIIKLEVNGGGSNSIHIKNTKIASVEVKKDAVRVAFEGNSVVEDLTVNAESTKIESENKIVIKSIEVSSSVEAVTIKGGTIQNIGVQSGEGQPAATPQIIIDGNTQIKNIEGTTEIFLTEEAVENGANVNIVSEKPLATFMGSTLTFLSDGSVTDPEFENQPYYYEYIFNLTSRNPELNAMGFKVMIYKLSNDIKVYAYGYSEEGFKAQEYKDIIVSGKSVKVQNLYDYILVLDSACIVKGEFTENRPLTLDDNSFDTKQLDINDCGMPLKLVFPENPYKPQVTVEGSQEGNVITITTNEVSPTIEIYKGQKNDSGEWEVTNKKLFMLDINTQKTYVFTDSYVTAGKEYAYYVNVYRYNSAAYDEYWWVPATGGLREIELKAKKVEGGIELEPEIIETPKNITMFYGIDRYRTDNRNAGETKFDNFIQEGKTIDSFVDYFVEPGKEYEYSIYYNFWNQTEHWNYYPHCETCEVTPDKGRGELKVTNPEKLSITYNSKTNKYTFTTIPTLTVTDFTDISDYKWINFMYSYEYEQNSFNSFDVGYNFTNSEYEINKLDPKYYGNYTYDKVYSVSLDYENDISYHSVCRNGPEIPGLVDINISE